MNKKLITSGEAAKILKISRQGMSYLVSKGVLKPVQIVELPSGIARRYRFFSEAAIMEYKKERQRG